jgi:hypothetical protein
MASWVFLIEPVWLQFSKPMGLIDFTARYALRAFAMWSLVLPPIAALLTLALCFSTDTALAEP